MSAKSKAFVEHLLELADVRIDGSRPWDIKVNDDRIYDRVMSFGTLGFGEAYMDGWWEAGAVDQLVYRLLRYNVQSHIKFDIAAIVGVARSRLLNLQRRRVYEVGNNDKALRLVGASPQRIRFTLYCVSGVLAALGGVVTNAWLLVARPGAGEGLDLQSITIAVLGGTYIFGGRGRVADTLLAVLLIVILNSGLQLAGVDPAWQAGVLGSVLILSVVLNNLHIRRSGERA